jgi:hypothetical protein
MLLKILASFREYMSKNFSGDKDADTEKTITEIKQLIQLTKQAEEITEDLNKLGLKRYCFPDSIEISNGFHKLSIVYDYSLAKWKISDPGESNNA